jgi:hypothetical protein
MDPETTGELKQRRHLGRRRPESRGAETAATTSTATTTATLTIIVTASNIPVHRSPGRPPDERNPDTTNNNNTAAATTDPRLVSTPSPRLRSLPLPLPLSSLSYPGVGRQLAQGKHLDSFGAGFVPPLRSPK